MTEENQVTTTVTPSPDVVVPSTTVETPVVSPVENQAREQGWVSKEEWVAGGGESDDWKSAREFVRTGELYSSLHSQKRELKQTQAALTLLQRHHNMVFEKAHKQALDDLKMERRLALREGDVELLENVEGRIEEAQTEHQEARQVMAQTQAATQSINSGEFDAFVSRNQWYVSDQDLRDEADAIGFVYLNKGGTKENLLRHVEQKIKQKFPEKFPTRRAAPNAVATPNKGVGRKSNDLELTENETEAMRTFVKLGVMTEAQYKADLKKVKERN